MNQIITKQILDVIDRYVKWVNQDENTFNFEIVNVTQLTESIQLISFSFQVKDDGLDGESVAIVYRDGEGPIFVLRDWQQTPPTSLEDICRYEWVDAKTGADAFMYDGLPVESGFLAPWAYND